MVNILTGISLPGRGEGVKEKGEYKRQDRKDDLEFYQNARMEAHMGVETLGALRTYYKDALGNGSGVAHIDLCSSFSCHFPESYQPAGVTGMGMNEAELAANERLTARHVQNLNKEKELPFADNSFSVATNCASIEYLTDPLTHCSEVQRVLSPGGSYHISFTSRAFWTKATKIWTLLTHEERMVLVASYLSSGGFSDVAAYHITSPGDEDIGIEPLAVIVGRA